MKDNTHFTIPRTVEGWVNLHTYVDPSTESFFDFSGIWCVCRGRWV